ncbi:MAG TPA: nucleotidyltransferase family protein [Candidatus Edwardsbacteria bacterium]|nr:nucleotidyltransferase family protein [Candidatus Edwardsbacteria bacterium]
MAALIKPSPEFELLLLCCRAKLHAPHDARLAALLRAAPDWDLLLRLARRHGMVPLLHRRLEEQAWRGVPQDVGRSIKTAYRAHLIRNLEMTKQLFLLLDLLARRSLRALPVKGPVLAAQAFGDVGLRAFADLDLLIAPEDFWECYRLLRDAGFVPEVELGQRAALTYAAQEAAMGFVNKGNGTAVELHWNFLPRCFGLRYDFDARWDARRPVNLERRPAAAMSDDDTFRHLLLHGFKHGWDRLSLVADIAQAGAALRIDWDAIGSDHQSGTMINAGLLLADALAGGVIPGGAIERAGRDRSARRLAASFARHLAARQAEARGIGALGRIYAAGQRGFAGRATFLWRLVFTPTVEDWKRRRFPNAFWRYAALRPWRLLADHAVTPGP